MFLNGCSLGLMIFVAANPSRIQERNVTLVLGGAQWLTTNHLGEVKEFIERDK